ncbi:MAG: response regulator [Thermodesulfovibrionales bacterium]|jgi:two-component system chemotaxis sensor kinase CheA
MPKDSAFLKKLLATFEVEAAEHIAMISSGLIELEKSPDAEKQAEIIETVFRESHSMKGAARAVNLTLIENVCQSFENVLAALKRREIVPGREILDVLHRGVNTLGELLATVKKEGILPEKASIRDLVRELESVAKKAEPKKRPEAVEKPQAVLPPLVSREEPPSEEASAAVLRRTETMRISKERLDSIFLQAEGLLSAKLLMGQRIIELREIISHVAALKKEWEEIRHYARKAGGPPEKNGGAVVNSAEVKKLADVLETKGDRISKLHDALISLIKASEHDSRSFAAMADSLLEDLKTVSMLPFSSLLEMLPKVVRDLSHDRGKEASLTTSGGEIEIDRRVLDEIREPLIHLVRNCIDHGIEKPEERAKRKKPLSGVVAIDIGYSEGKSVKIAVSDDGAGVDISKVRNSAVRLGIFSRQEVNEMDEQRLLPLIFRSGVTTSPIITDISGRGLGLAIVQERVERMGGALFCETSEGKGTTFRIVLPLTLATFRGVLVQADDRHFVIPITGLDRTMRVSRDEIRTVENRETITVGGLTIPLVSLRAVLEMPRKGKGGTGGEFAEVAVLGAAEHRIAFSVDAVLHEQEVIVKDLGKQLSRVRNVAGATVLGTGKVVPVLNVSDLLKSAVKISPAAEAPALVGETVVAKKSILVVEDSITARTLLKNILESAGYDVQTAVDGIDAFTALKAGQFDMVISDIDMPRMNGLDLTVKIREDKKFGGLPVVLVTALESREDRERGIDVGANAYIVKSSFDQSNLLEVIKRLT